MGERFSKIVLYALGGAILADMLIHVAGTNAFFSGLGGLATSTYKAASGAYASNPN